MTDRKVDRTQPGVAGLTPDCSILNAYGWQRELAAREALIRRCTTPGCSQDAPWGDRQGLYCVAHVPDELRFAGSGGRRFLQAAE